MPTEVSIQFTDKMQSWYESSTSLFVFAWAELDGIFIAGDKENAVPGIVFAQTGDLNADVQGVIEDVMTALTGDAPQPYAFPALPAFLTYGVSNLPYGNTTLNRPLVALGYKNTYTFGTLAIPARDGGAGGTELVWKFLIYSTAAAVDVSPVWNDILAYRAANAGANPSLLVLELNAQ